MESNKKKASEWFKNLRDSVCECFEEIENIYSGRMTKIEPGKFERKSWDRPGGGGGEISIMKGRVFEKVGVNFSEVYGKFSPKFQSKIANTWNFNTKYEKKAIDSGRKTNYLIFKKKYE